jgi:hypothetical protein
MSRRWGALQPLSAEFLIIGDIEIIYRGFAGQLPFFIQRIQGLGIGRVRAQVVGPCVYDLKSSEQFAVAKRSPKIVRFAMSTDCAKNMALAAGEAQGHGTRPFRR